MSGGRGQALVVEERMTRIMYGEIKMVKNGNTFFKKHAGFNSKLTFVLQQYIQSVPLGSWEIHGYLFEGGVKGVGCWGYQIQQQ